MKHSTLAEKFPELVKQWDFDKNEGLSPQTIAPYSEKLVWWRCAMGHTWQASVADLSRGRGCPYCFGYRPIPGVSDLQTLYPEIAAEWHPERNGSLLPSQTARRSNKIVWWRCQKGHEWRTSVNNRIGHGQGCPFCFGRLAISGKTDLAARYPEIADEWNYERNQGLFPSELPAHSNRLIWWKCSEGHEWQATPNNRVHGKGCPYCSGRLAISGVNDLVTLFPEIAAEWHPDRNGDLLPSQVKPFSHKLVWWKCKEGHEWKTIVYNRTRGRSCPYCMGSRVIPGVNDLATQYPELAVQWYQERNSDLHPEKAGCYSSKKVWWQCDQGHIWQAEIGNRVRTGSRCPFCMGLEKRKV